MYALMGVGAVHPRRHRPAPRLGDRAGGRRAGLRPDFVAAVVIGLAAHLPARRRPRRLYERRRPAMRSAPRAAGVLLFGWNRSGGDLRIAHFLGIHAQQALPLLAALVGGLTRPTRWTAADGGNDRLCGAHPRPLRPGGGRTPAAAASSRLRASAPSPSCGRRRLEPSPSEPDTSSSALRLTLHASGCERGW